MAKARETPPIGEDESVRYVIYVRRSMEKDEKQKASIPQQLEQCFQFAKNSEILLAQRPSNAPIDDQTITEIEETFQNNPKKCAEIKEKYTKYYVIAERKSAKEPGKRELWSTLAKHIQDGKIRGLFGYSPDRFARNLQEGGKLIQCVDKNILRLKFTNFAFENNASGHMMLGIFFVFAEHYSKKLSEDSRRSIEQRTLEGRTGGAPKIGYKSNRKNKEDTENDYFVPNEPNFSILKKAFFRKLRDNWSDERIAKEMNESGWEGEKMTFNRISYLNLWSDAFFYGVWTREFKDGTSVTVDLRNLPNCNFQPAISESDFLELQEKLIQTNRKSQEQRKSRITKRLDAVTPLANGIVVDAETKAKLSFSIPNAKRYREKLEKTQEKNPETKLSDIVKPHQIKYSIKGNNINFEELDDFLAKEFKKIKIPKEDYQAYLYALREKIKQRYDEKKQQQKRVDLLLNKNASEEEKFATNSGFGKTLSTKERKIYEKKMKVFKSKEAELLEEKAKISQDTRDEVLEEQAFYELLFHLPKLWKKANYVQKHKISEILLLNIEVKNGELLNVAVQPDFSSWFPQKFKGGGQGQN